MTKFHLYLPDLTEINRDRETNTGGFVKAQKSELDEQDTRTDESPAHLHRRRRPPPSGQRRINRAFT